MVRPFARLPRADELPGACGRCGRKEDVFDLGFEGIPGYGVPVLCSMCMGALFTATGAVQAATHESMVEGLRQQLEEAQEALRDANRRASLPVDTVRDILKEYSRGIDAANRHLVDDLDRAAARWGGVSGDPVPADDDGADAVPRELAGGAGEPEPGAVEPAAGADRQLTRDDILERLGVPAATAPAPDGVFYAPNAAPAEDGGVSDVWGLIFGRDAGEAGEGDDDVPRD